MKLLLRMMLTAIFSVLVALGLVLLGGFVCKDLLGERAYAAGKIIAYVFAGALLVFDLVSLALGGRYVKKKGRDAKALEAEMKKRGAEIREDYRKAGKKLCRMRVWIRLYIALFVLMAAWVCFFTGDGEYVPLWLWAWYILFAFFAHLGSRVEKPDFKNYAKREDYPVLYAVAERAARAVGVEGNIRILFLGGMDAGIARFGKDISLQLSVDLIAFCREEELFQVLLHEFAHIKGGKINGSPADKFALFLEGVEGATHNPISDGYFLFPAAVYGYEVRIYKIMSSILVEEGADKAMKTFGAPQIAANALGKIAVHDCFIERLDLYMGVPYFQAEEYPRAFTETVYDRFLALLPEQEAFWRELVQKELQPRYGSHPIMRKRIKKLGVTSFELTPPETEGAYFDECVKARRELDEALYKEKSKDYPKEREECYLKPLRRVEEWEQAGKPYDPSSVRGLMADLSAVERYDDLLSLCEKILEEEKGGLADYARFTRGNILLDRFDARGIEDLYAAMEGNRNYIEGGIERIGAFCCRMGLQEELDACRARYVDCMQRLIDARPAEILSASDKLSESDLPAELHEKNLRVILENGKDCIKRVFLMKKEWKDHAEYNYVVEFLPKTHPEVIGEAMDAIFYYLDNAEEQYALFLYGPREAAAVKKVKNSCIYTKE